MYNIMPTTEKDIYCPIYMAQSYVDILSLRGREGGSDELEFWVHKKGPLV